MVLIDYTPISGKRKWFRIEPLQIRLGKMLVSEKVDQWLLEAVDIDTNTTKAFSMHRITAWREVPTTDPPKAA